MIAPDKRRDHTSVFVPCTLTILGVIMFLRFGQVVGRAGLYYAVAIVLAANVLTLLTSRSLSAIATNTRVKGGVAPTISSAAAWALSSAAPSGSPRPS
jgi:membrane-associated PAP2 superfamily phosphatase